MGHVLKNTLYGTFYILKCFGILYVKGQGNHQNTTKDRLVSRRLSCLENGLRDLFDLFDPIFCLFPPPRSLVPGYDCERSKVWRNAL